MHELALMEEVRLLALQHLEAQGAQRLHRLHLRVGSLSGVEPEALAFAFEVVMADAREAGATLHLEVVPTVCRCPDCGSEFAPIDVIFACPRCGTLSADIRRGRELELVSLELS